MKIYRSQNKNITEIFAGSFFGTQNIAENYVEYKNDVLFEIEISNQSTFCDAFDFGCDIDAGLENDDNLKAVGLYDFIFHNWERNGSYGKTYFSTKNIILSEIKQIEVYVDDDGAEIVVYSAKGTLKEVSLDEIKTYTSRDEYNKR